MDEHDARELIGRVFAADQALDLDAFMALLTDDVQLRVGSTPWVAGKPAARRVIGGLFAAVRGIEHRLLRGPFLDGDRLSYFAEVTFTRRDGARVTLPYANALVLSGERLSEYDIHMDPTPLLAPPVGAAALMLAAGAGWLGYRLGRSAKPATSPTLTGADRH